MSKAAAVAQIDFAGIVGDSSTTAEPAACAAAAVDGLAPQCVVYPGSAEEVAEVLKCCSLNNAVVIPRGNGTGLGLGGRPRRYDVALCLNRMKQVKYYEPDDLVTSVEPGLEFCELQRLLEQRQLWVPLDPSGGSRATVGGILATNSAGPLRLRYGGPRDMVLGLKMATTGGKLVKSGGRVVKNVAGYDLGKLLIGSLGTLAVIVEATFKLYPQVRERVTWCVEIGAPSGAREFRRSLLASPLSPLRAVLLNAAARGVIAETSPAGATVEPAILIEAGGSERVLARYESELGLLARGQKAPIRKIEAGEAKRAWARIADFGVALVRDDQIPLVLRTAVPIAACEEFLERAEEEALGAGWELAGLVQPGIGVVELGFLGDGPSGGRPVAGTAELQFPDPALIGRLRQVAASLGGTLVVSRCPVELKSGIDIWGPPGDDFEVMRKLKAAWDPEGILSPGRFVGSL